MDFGGTEALRPSVHPSNLYPSCSRRCLPLSKSLWQPPEASGEDSLWCSSAPSDWLADHCQPGISLKSLLSYWIAERERDRERERERERERCAQFRIRFGPVLEKLNESHINSNLDRNSVVKQTVGKLHDRDGNILWTCELDALCVVK